MTSFRCGGIGRLNIHMSAEKKLSFDFLISEEDILFLVKSEGAN